MKIAGVADGGSAELDLRLASGAAAAWLALLAVRSAGAGSAAVIAGLGCLAGLLGLLLCRRWPLLAVAGLIGWCVAGVVLPYALREAATRASPITRLAARREPVQVDLVVSGDPRPLTGGSTGAGRVAVDATLLAIVHGGQRSAASGRVLVFAPASGWIGLLPGQRVRAEGRLGPTPDRLSVAVLTVRFAPAVLARAPPWQRAAERLRGGLRRASAVLPPDAAGLLPGLVVGDTSGMDPVLAQRFRSAGLTHLVAVSGANCVIVVGAVLLVLRRLRAPPWLSAAVAGVTLAGFVVVARASPSVVRAAVMAAIALLALALGRPRAGMPIVAAATLVTLVWHPEWADDAGFAMSVLATAALLVLAPRWAHGLRRRHVPPVVAELVAVGAAAHLVTAPIVVMISGQVSVVAVLANVLAEPAVAPATVLGVLAALASLVGRWPAQALVWLAGWPARWLVWVANVCGATAQATVGWPSSVGGAILLALVIAVSIGLSRSRRLRPSLVVALLVALLIQVPVRHIVVAWPPPHWLIVACDVGQGDALVLTAGRHAAVVVDTGPDPVLADRCLRDLHVSDVSLLIITHLHLDHVGGIDGLVRGRRVGAVITGPLDDPQSGLRIAEHALRPRHLALRVGVPGEVITAGDVRLTVLGPDVAYRGTRSDPNNSSLVVRAEVAGERILLAGDAEIDAQQSLLRSGADLRADILKVPHHGSAYSDPAFLAAVHARVGLISVGLHNDYGHPAPSLLAALGRLGMPFLRTDRDGASAVTGTSLGLRMVHRAHRDVGRIRQPVGARALWWRAGLLLAVSARRDRIEAWLTRRRILRGAAPPGQVSSCYSATRSTSPRGPSSRSPPRSAPVIPAPSSPSVSVQRSGRGSWPSC